MSRRKRNDSQESTDDVASLLLRWMSASMRAGRSGMSESLRLLTSLGLTMPMTVALHVLAFSGPQTMTEISNHLGLSPSATSHLLQRLVDLELVRRADDPMDRRRRHLAITARGQRAVDAIVAARMAEMRSSLAPLSAATLATLKDALYAVLADLNRAERPVCPALPIHRAATTLIVGKKTSARSTEPPTKKTRATTKLIHATKNSSKEKA